MKTAWLLGLIVINGNMFAAEAERKQEAQVNIEKHYQVEPDLAKLEIIRKIGENVHPDNITLNGYLSPLATAIKYDDLGFTNVLCKLGADVNKIYNAGGWLEQPLIYAESLPMVQLLIDNKALPAGRESRVQDPLDDAQKNWSYKTPHMIAAWLIAGADPNRFYENSRCVKPLYAFGTLILSYHSQSCKWGRQPER